MTVCKHLTLNRALWINCCQVDFGREEVVVITKVVRKR